MKIAITGVSGYLGVKLLEYLESSAKLNKIVGLDLKKPPNLSKLTFYQIDIRDRKIVDIFKDEEVELVIHLAFIVKELRNRKKMRSIDIDGTRNVLSAIDQTPSVNKFIVLSSVSAYGAHPDNPQALKESSPIRGDLNKFQYAKDKAEMDRMVQEFIQSHPKVSVTMFRPTFVMGPNVNNFFSFYIEKFPVVPISRDSRGKFQLIHEDDMKNLMIQAIEQEIPGIYNAAAPRPITYIDLLKLAGKRYIKLPNFVVYPAANLLWWLGIAGASGQQIDFIRYSYVEDTSRLHEKFNYNFQYDTIETFIDYLKGKGMTVNESYLHELSKREG
ncbi:MAG: NAD-dependent epimerase/dehydratase family protein [Candidatus Hodarchaeales archaeon]